jgi:hypothetical protein
VERYEGSSSPIRGQLGGWKVELVYLKSAHFSCFHAIAECPVSRSSSSIGRDVRAGLLGHGVLAPVLDISSLFDILRC